MLAEAAERGWISGNPATYYNEAIAASMDYWDVSADAAAAYIARVPYDNSNGWAPEGDVTWKQTLGIQKWIALYMQGLQGWSVFRRLDFDNVLVIPPQNPGKSLFQRTFPARLPFPVEKPSLNNAPPDSNYATAVNKYLGGVDTQGTPLWWDDTEIGKPLGEGPLPLANE